jgi:hypothetical protein
MSLPDPRIFDAAEDWPGQWESDARLAQLKRQANLGRGWHRRGFRDYSAELEEQLLDPEQKREEAYRAEKRRLTAAERGPLDGHDAWLTIEIQAEQWEG